MSRRGRAHGSITPEQVFTVVAEKAAGTALSTIKMTELCEAVWAGARQVDRASVYRHLKWLTTRGRVRSFSAGRDAAELEMLGVPKAEGLRDQSTRYWMLSPRPWA